MPNSGSTCNQSLRESRLPGLWIRVECARDPRACVSLLLPPQSSPTPPAWCPPGALLPVEMPRRQHSQEGGFSWGPQCHIAWVLGEFILALEARGSGHHRWGALGILVPARENQTTSLSGVSMKHTLPGCLRPTTVQPWDASLLGASVRITGMG